MTVAPDAATSLPKIRSLRVRPRYRLEIHWDNEAAPMIVDMEGLITEGSAFAALRDHDLFATVRIGERRRTIEWPDPLHAGSILTDYDADSLYLRGERQQSVSILQRMMRDFQAMRRRIVHGIERESV